MDRISNDVDTRIRSRDRTIIRLSAKIEKYEDALRRICSHNNTVNEITIAAKVLQEFGISTREI